MFGIEDVVCIKAFTFLCSQWWCCHLVLCTDSFLWSHLCSDSFFLKSVLMTNMYPNAPCEQPPMLKINNSLFDHWQQMLFQLSRSHKYLPGSNIIWKGWVWNKCDWVGGRSTSKGIGEKNYLSAWMLILTLTGWPKTAKLGSETSVRVHLCTDFQHFADFKKDGGVLNKTLHLAFLLFAAARNTTEHTPKFTCVCVSLYSSKDVPFCLWELFHPYRFLSFLQPPLVCVSQPGKGFILTAV